MSKKPVIGVLGSGSWATALVKMLCENVEELNWWVRSQDTIDHTLIHRNNPKYIQSIQFQVEKLKLTTDMEFVIESSDILIVCLLYTSDAADE